MLKPPWIAYPHYPPYDAFWRQSGQYWFAYEWEPFWNNLPNNKRTLYLKKWKPPQVWIDFYFNTQWLDKYE